MIYKFQYKIESFNQGDSRIFVLYFPENTNLPVIGEYFYVNENMTQEDINTMIVNSVPVYKWIRFEENEITKNNVQNFISSEKSEIKTYTIEENTEPPEKTPEEIAQELSDGRENKARDIRIQRNTILLLTDHTQIEDYLKDDKQDWKTYRQELRNITDQETFPDSVEWPTPPLEVNSLYNLNYFIK